MIGDRRYLWYPALMLACILAAWTSAPAQPRRPTAKASANTRQNADKPATTTLYVGLFNAQLVSVYDAFGSGQPSAQLLDGMVNATGGIAVDGTKHVYVSIGGGNVMVYPGGSLVPVQRYRFPDQPSPSYPLGIAVGGDGTLYAPLNLAGVVAVYPKGDTKQASLTISMPSGDTAMAAAVDSQNNLYIEYGPPHYPSSGYIEKCPPNSSQCTDLGIVLGAPGYNLVVDSQGNIIACDELAAQIDVFPPGGTQPRVISQGLTCCPYFALDKKQDRLFVANQKHDGSNQGVISVFDYASGTLVNTISGGIPSGDFIEGVALSPSLR
ncbi:MAG: hypothetical protein ACRD3Q_03755 [Terriglobales bacterium]